MKGKTQNVIALIIFSQAAGAVGSDLVGQVRMYHNLAWRATRSSSMSGRPQNGEGRREEGGVGGGTGCGGRESIRSRGSASYYHKIPFRLVFLSSKSESIRNLIFGRRKKK